MIADIVAFKERVLASPDIDTPGRFYGAVADFGDRLNREFRAKFFNLEPSLYWQADEWKTLIGYSQGTSARVPNEIVLVWLREKIRLFLAEQAIELGLSEN